MPTNERVEVVWLDAGGKYEKHRHHTYCATLPVGVYLWNSSRELTELERRALDETCQYTGTDNAHHYNVLGVYTHDVEEAKRIAMGFAQVLRRVGRESWAEYKYDPDPVEERLDTDPIEVALATGGDIEEIGRLTFGGDTFSRVTNVED